MAKKPARPTRQTSKPTHTAQPTPRQRWRLPLHSLVRLNWKGTQELPPQNTAPANVERVRLKDQEYQVEALESEHTSYVRLEPRRHYLAIPLNEPDQPQRYLLVREQKSFSANRTYLVVTQPGAEERAADDGTLAHIHILGGYVDRPDTVPDAQEPDIVGVAEAILVPLGTAGNEESIQPTVDQSQPPVEPPPPMDEDLLCCIDALNSLIERYPDVELDLAAAQKQFHDYVQRRYNLSVISIARGKTAFDENAGHQQTGISRFSKVDDGIITTVQSDGYHYVDHGLARPAQVVVNHHATEIVKLRRLIVIRPGRLYVELHIPDNTRRSNVFLETARQASALDLLYAWLAFYQIAQATDFKQAFGQLEHQLSADNLMRDVLPRVQNRPLRLTYLYHSSQMCLILHGEAAAVQALHHILHAEALQRENIGRANPDWLLTELRRLRPNVPPGLKIQEFDDFTSQSLAKIRELMDQLAFAPEFVEQQRIDDDHRASAL